MNLILLHPEDFTDSNTVHLSDRRFQHLRTVNKAEVGQTFKAGIVNGNLGRATVIHMDDKGITLNTQLDQVPPKPLPVTLLLAMPRPKMLKRTLETIATMGVKHLILINSYRVDKSYWSTPLLSDQAVAEFLTLGLEQAGDTLMPKVEIKKRFKPFVEDELPALMQNKTGWVAHPYNAQPCPPAADTPTLLAIGPEGGFIEYEVNKLQAAGLTPIHLGSRILRVETAVPVLLSRLFPIF